MRPLFALPFPSVLLLSLLSTDVASAQAALSDLLARIPAREAGDRNRYSLTDVQYALRARLDWNALLRRARIVEEESGLSFTVVVGSTLGSCGSEMVEWPQAPAMRNGQVYVSEELLATVFSNFPDFRFPGSEETEEPLDLPPIDPLEEMALEEPPDFYTEDSSKSLTKITAVFVSSKPEIGEGTEARTDPAEALSSRIRESLSVEGLAFETRVWGGAAGETPEADGDALVSFRIVPGTPAPKSSFFYYDSPTLPTQSRSHGLVEWDRTNPQQRGASRAWAETFHRNFSEVFGPNRTAGVLGGPIDLLQGHRVPAIQVNFGVSSASQEQEIARMVEVVKNSLSQLKSES